MISAHWSGGPSVVKLGFTNRPFQPDCGERPGGYRSRKYECDDYSWSGGVRQPVCSQPSSRSSSNKLCRSKWCGICTSFSYCRCAFRRRRCISSRSTFEVPWARSNLQFRTAASRGLRRWLLTQQRAVLGLAAGLRQTPLPKARKAPPQTLSQKHRGDRAIAALIESRGGAI